MYQILQKENITAILVTHNIEEAICFSNKVVILSKRPSIITNIITINIANNKSIYERRKDPTFNQYFDKIWEDLEIT